MKTEKEGRKMFTGVKHGRVIGNQKSNRSILESDTADAIHAGHSAIDTMR